MLFIVLKIVVVVHLSRETVMLLVIWVNVVLDIAITRRLVIGVVEGESKDGMTLNHAFCAELSANPRASVTAHIQTSTSLNNIALVRGD